MKKVELYLNTRYWRAALVNDTASVVNIMCEGGMLDADIEEHDDYDETFYEAKIIGDYEPDPNNEYRLIRKDSNEVHK